MRPTSFPLAARAHLKRYRACVYYNGGFFLADVDAMSKDEADRIGVHYFMLSDRRDYPIKHVDSIEM